MVNRPRAIGTKGETAVVRYARDNGFPGAERLALHGTADEGDATLCPGVAAEVKSGREAETASDALVGKWLAEAESERVARGCDVMLLVRKRAGKGPASVGQWWVHLPGPVFIDLAVPGPFGYATPVGHEHVPPVTLTLDQALTLLRASGFGSTLPDAGAETPVQPPAAAAGTSTSCEECRDFYSGIPTHKHDLELGCAPTCPCSHDHANPARLVFP